MTNPPRLLLINYECPPLGGGAGTATAALAREFAALGADVRVLTSTFENLPRHESQNGISIHRIPVVRRRADRSSVFEMLTFIASACWHGLTLTRNWRPDATLAFFGIPGGPPALWLNWMRGIPYIVSLRGGDVPGHQPGQLDTHHRLTKPFIKLIWRQARAVVANSTGLRTQALITAPHLQIPVIPNGVDTTLFRPSEKSAIGNRQSAIINLLFVGRLSPEKGLHTLLDALAATSGFRSPPSSLSLTLAGDGPDRAALQAQATRLGLTDRVTFAGWIPRERLPELYRAADIFVFPSTDEGMPNTVLEAMASGLPVIACRIAGCEDLVEEGITGLLIPPNDTAALATAIATLCNDAPLRTRLGQSARTRVLAHFTWRRAAEEYVKLLQPPGL